MRRASDLLGWARDCGGVAPWHFRFGYTNAVDDAGDQLCRAWPRPLYPFRSHRFEVREFIRTGFALASVEPWQPDDQIYEA